MAKHRTTLQQRIEMNERKMCSACSKSPRFKISQYCRQCHYRNQNYGHPKADAPLLKLFKPYLAEILWHIQERYTHPLVQESLTKIRQVRLRIANEDYPHESEIPKFENAFTKKYKRLGKYTKAMLIWGRHQKLGNESLLARVIAYIYVAQEMPHWYYIYSGDQFITSLGHCAIRSGSLPDGYLITSKWFKRWIGQYLYNATKDTARLIIEDVLEKRGVIKRDR